MPIVCVNDPAGSSNRSAVRILLLSAAVWPFIFGPGVPIVRTQSVLQLAWDQDLSLSVDGFAVTIDGSRTDYGLTPLAGDGTCGCSIPLPFSSGLHTVVVGAYNSAGETSSTLLVGPIPDAAGPYSGQTGTAITVDASGSTDSTGTIVGYTWSWGDGTSDTSSSVPTASHTYTGAGTFTITLTVTDDLPATATASATATITGSTWKPGFDWPGGNGLDGDVWSLVVFDDGSGPALYAGGTFTTAGGVPANSIAKWNGATWTPLSSGLNGSGGVWALAVFDDGTGPALYAGGSFTIAGGGPGNFVAKWNGTNWAAVGGGMDADVRALTVFDDGTGPALYAGGFFTMADGGSTPGIAKWAGTAWAPLNNGVAGGGVLALSVFDDGHGPALYAGGNFSVADGNPVNSIAKWDGTSWHPLDVGTDGAVAALTVFDAGSGPAVYAGGSFTMAGGIAADSVAEWNGMNWAPLNRGMNGGGGVLALAVFDDGSGPGLYAGGNFTIAAGGPGGGIAKWDGSNWTAVDRAMDGWVLALTRFGGGGTRPALYVGGSFTVIDSVSSSRLAEWSAQ
jgi:PKD repeat protein